MWYEKINVLFSIGAGALGGEPGDFFDALGFGGGEEPGTDFAEAGAKVTEIDKEHYEFPVSGLETISLQNLNTKIEEIATLKQDAERLRDDLLLVTHPTDPEVQKLNETIAYLECMESGLIKLRDDVERLEALEVEMKSSKDGKKLSDDIEKLKGQIRREIKAIELNGKTLVDRDMQEYRNTINELFDFLHSGRPGEVIITDPETGERRWVHLDTIEGVTFDSDAGKEIPLDMARALADYVEEAGPIRITEGYPAADVHKEGSLHESGRAIDFVPAELSPGERPTPEKTAALILAGERVGVKVFFEDKPGTIEDSAFEKKVVDLLVEGGMSREEADARVRENGSTAPHFHLEKRDAVSMQALKG